MIENNTVTLKVVAIFDGHDDPRDDVIRCRDGAGRVHLIPMDWWKGPDLESVKWMPSSHRWEDGFHITLQVGMVLEDNVKLQEADVRREVHEGCSSDDCIMEAE